jgi:flagellar motor switch protein FliG
VTSDSIRKAAVLIRSLDAEAAATLLMQLSDAEAKAIRAAIRRLGDIDPAEQAEVAAALRQPSAARPESALSGGVELELSSTTSAASVLSVMERGSQLHAFIEADEAEASVIANFLKREHPQTMAVVVSYLRPTLAAKVLGELSAELQDAVIASFANLGDIPPDNLRVLTEGLQNWIEAHRTEQQRQANRSAKLSAICAAAGDQLRARIASHLPAPRIMTPPPARTETASPVTFIDDLAPPVKSDSVALDLKSKMVSSARPAMPFDSLERLDDDMLVEVMRNVGGDVLVLALAGAKESFLRRIEARLSRAAIRQLHRRLAALTNVKLSEVDRAQQTMVQVALELRRSTAFAA